MDKVIHLLLYLSAKAMPHEKRLEWVRTGLLDYAEKAIFRGEYMLLLMLALRSTPVPNRTVVVTSWIGKTRRTRGEDSQSLQTNERNSAIVLPPVRQG